MAPHLMEILPHMWNTLTQSADRYVRTVVNYTDDADDPVDSDGECVYSLLYCWRYSFFVTFSIPCL